MNPAQENRSTTPCELGDMIDAQLIKNAIVFVSTLRIGQIVEPPNDPRRANGAAALVWKLSDSQ